MASTRIESPNRPWQDGRAHTPSRYIEHYREEFGIVDQSRLAKDIQDALSANNVSLINPKELTGTIRIFKNGSWEDVSAAEYLSKQLHRANHQGILLSTGGIDPLLTGDPDIMQVDDALSLAASIGKVDDGVWTLLGPAGGATSKSHSKPGEEYDATVVRIVNGSAVETGSVTKRVSFEKDGTVAIEEEENTERVILSQHVGLNVLKEEKDDAQKPFLLKIEGGNTTTNIEQALKDALEAQGIKQAAFFIVASGSDMITNAAILDQMPDSSGIENLQELIAYQNPRTFVGGTMMVNGHFTPHHPDQLLRERTGRTYQLHRHGIGESTDGKPIGGHINGVVPGENTVAYVVVKPIKEAIEIDGERQKAIVDRVQAIKQTDSSISTYEAVTMIHPNWEEKTLQLLAEQIDISLERRTMETPEDVKERSANRLIAIKVRNALLNLQPEISFDVAEIQTRAAKMRLENTISWSVPEGKALTQSEIIGLRMEQMVLQELVKERTQVIANNPDQENPTIQSAIHELKNGTEYLTRLGTYFAHCIMTNSQIDWNIVVGLADAMLSANRNAQKISKRQFKNNSETFALSEIDRVAMKMLSGKQIATLSALISSMAATQGELSNNENGPSLREHLVSARYKNILITELLTSNQNNISLEELVLQGIFPFTRTTIEHYWNSQGNPTGVFDATENFIRNHPALLPIINRIVSADFREPDESSIGSAQIVYWASNDIGFFKEFQSALGPYREPVTNMKLGLAQRAAQILNAQKGGKVLDLASGHNDNNKGPYPKYALPGLILDQLTDEAATNTFITLSDMSAQSLDEVYSTVSGAREGNDQAMFLDISHGHIPYADSSAEEQWDMIVSSLGIHQLTYPQMKKLFAEMRRKVKQGGFVLLGTVRDHGKMQFATIPTNLTDTENVEPQPPFTNPREKVRDLYDPYNLDTVAEMPLEWLYKDMGNGTYDMLVPVPELTQNYPIYGRQAYVHLVVSEEQINKVKNGEWTWRDLLTAKVK